MKALLDSGKGRNIFGLKFMKNTLDLPYFAFAKRGIFACGRQRNFLSDSGAARNEDKKGCRIPSLSPPYFFF